MSLDTHSNARISLRKNLRERRVLFTAIFTIYFIAAICARLAPWRWLRRASSQRTSAFREARSAANRAIGFAYMG